MKLEIKKDAVIIIDDFYFFRNNIRPFCELFMEKEMLQNKLQHLLFHTFNPLQKVHRRQAKPSVFLAKFALPIAPLVLSVQVVGKTFRSNDRGSYRGTNARLFLASLFPITACLNFFFEFQYLLPHFIVTRIPKEETGMAVDCQPGVAGRNKWRICLYSRTVRFPAVYFRHLLYGQSNRPIP